jgi:LacI family transcriptional regulator
MLVPSPGLVVRESTDFVAVHNEVVAAAMAFISANSHRSIGQDDVAHAINVETRTLQNYFRKHLGRPIVTEIRRVRIERAKRELVNGKRSMAEIAHCAGFGSSMRMYEVFRRELGVTPSEYRRQRQVENGN